MKKIKILVLSILLSFGFLCFGFCDEIKQFNRLTWASVPSHTTVQFFPGYCIVATASNRFVFTGDHNTALIGNQLYCVDFTGYLYNTYSSSINLYYYTGIDLSSSSCPTCPTCEECEECVECPVIDSLYCLNNGLCPSNECTGGNTSGGIAWSSALYINGINHQSAPMIDITIPEEFEWNYTGNNEIFTLDVVGYNTDSDYIAGIINTQKSKPNNQDFNNIVSGIIPLLIPGLVVILFIYFVFRFIKKVF